MYLLYMHPYGTKEPQKLCMLATRADEFSVPVPIDTIELTRSAVYRLGPHEAFTAFEGGEPDSLVIKPVVPSKFWITPNQNDRPGFEVARMKIVRVSSDPFTYYAQDKDDADVWHEWDPTARL